MKINLLKYVIVFLTYPLIIIFTFQISLDINKSVSPNKNTPNIILQKIVVIDPGHGGIDLGTVKNELMEKDITLSIAKKLQILLAQNGYNVLLTRDGDTPLYERSSIAGSQERKDLDGRIQYAQKNNAKLFVSIHVDSLVEDPGQKGSIVYYFPKLNASKAYAISIQKALNNMLVDNKLWTKNYIETGDFYVVKHSEIPSVLVETAYITNSRDYKLLSKDSFRDELARAIYQGINNVE